MTVRLGRKVKTEKESQTGEESQTENESQTGEWEGSKTERVYSNISLAGY